MAPVAIPLVSRKKRGSHNSVVSVAETDLAYFGSRAFRDVVKLIGESLPPSRVGRPRRYALPLLVAAHYLHQDETAESALQALQLKRAEVITAISRSCGWSDGLAADSPIPSVQALKRFLAKIRHCSEDIASAVHEVAREDAVEKAKILGLPDNSEGSLLLPNKAACLIADGSFWSAASSHLPKSTLSTNRRVRFGIEELILMLTTTHHTMRRTPEVERRRQRQTRSTQVRDTNSSCRCSPRTHSRTSELFWMCSPY